MKRRWLNWDRLDLQLYAIIATLGCVCLVVAFVSLHVWRSERRERNLGSEREKLESALRAQHEALLNDVVLGHYEALQSLLNRMVREEHLERVDVVTRDGKILSREGSGGEREGISIQRTVPILLGETEYARVTAVKRVTLPSEIKPGFAAAIPMLFLFLLLGGLLLRYLVRTRVMEPMELLIRSLGDPEGPAEAVEARFQKASHDVFQLYRRFESMRSQLRRSQERLLAAEREAQYFELASRVAHDIRSPLAALLAVQDELEGLPDRKRQVLRRAVERIGDIANDLLRGAKEKLESTPKEEVAYLSSMVEELVSEKRLTLPVREGVRIESRIESDASCAFAPMPALEFKRTVSNLLDNAVQSLGTKGGICVRLARKKDQAEIRIEDNGCGVPRDILPRLAQSGFSYGKSGGNGLGLFHAKTSIEAYGGTLEITSELGQGTTVSIHLPLAPAPRWFPPAIDLDGIDEVLVVDDDLSIHQLWRDRLAAVAPSLRFFGSLAELEAWWTSANQTAKRRWLFDHEFAGEPQTGLDWIAGAGVGAQCVLVTSRYEDFQVREQAQALGVQILPKQASRTIPIETGAGAAASTVVLIDDDELVRKAWEMAGRRRGRVVRSFSSGADFLSSAGQFDRDIPVYVDLELSYGENGVEVSRAVHRLGFSSIFLATGHTRFRSEGYPWLKAVVGKSPAF